MNKKQVVTRMAPSPTGEFHIGGMRTLLYNWALARSSGGKFLIRIEDTDRGRFVEGATERLLQVIKDYGFNWDEGPEVGGPSAPYIQSERLPLYKKYAEELIEQKKAYYCFCTAERLEKMREEQKKNGSPSTKYDGLCTKLTKEEIEKNLSNGVSYVVRLKVPDNKEIKWDDAVLGEVSFNSSEIDDQVLLKSDGFPTYHLGVVVDDHLMGVNHVMRGNEWLPSTPKHVMLYEAFGWELPLYAHLPNLKEIGSNQKLSKRHGPVAASGFLEDGYLPEALVNHLMFLGWNPGGEKEIYSLEEFVKEFSIKKIHTADLVSFDRKKLDWFNSQYIKEKSDMELAKLLQKFAPKEATFESLTAIAPLIKERIKKLSEFSLIAKFFFEEPNLDTSLFSGNFQLHLQAAQDVLSNLSKWEASEMNIGLTEVVQKNKFDMREFFMDLRIAITGSKVTPPLNESMVILGKEKTVARLTKALK